MAIDTSSLFAGIEEAQERRDANYERPGHYIERIDNIKADRSRKGEEFLAIEKTVLHVLDDDNGEGHRVGQQVTHMLMKKHDSFLGNVKSFVANTLGSSPDEVKLDVCVTICAEDQPLSGIIIECQNRNQVTKKGTDFTIINYLGEVPVERLRRLMPAEALERHFPDGALDRMEAEQQKAEGS